MKTSTRWLTGFGIGVAALIIVVSVLANTFENRIEPLSQTNTPEGTVQSYLLALKAKDAERAKTYTKKDSIGLLEGDNSPRVALIKTETTGNQSKVYVSYKMTDHFSRSPFFLTYRGYDWLSAFSLVKEGDRWFITGEEPVIRH